jgi:S-DNA-T family DNA segregation ATPase FtsK/SpoIIIE
VKSVKIRKKKYKAKKKNTRKHNHEIYGVVLFAFGILVFLSVYIDNSIGPFGNSIKKLLTGLVGISSYVLPLIIIIYSIFMIFNKDGREFKLRVFYAIILLILVSSMMQASNYNYEDYQNKTFSSSIVRLFLDGNNLSGGGVLGGLLTLPLMTFFKPLGTIIILTALSVIVIILLTNISIAKFFLGVKNIFVKFFHSFSDKHSVVKENQTISDADYNYQPEGYYIDNEGLDRARHSKVIDFKIERDARASRETIKSASNVILDKKSENQDILKEALEIKESLAKNKTSRSYKYPKTELLISSDNTRNYKEQKIQAIEGAKILEETLASFGVDARVINICRGPAVTRYELQPSSGVKVSKIVALSDDIALNLASPGVRIEAPIPGKAAVGIEVPNKEVTPVLLKEVLESPEFIQNNSKLGFGLGKDISGECIIADISKMPHLLIAGATGSGKSVCINCLIMSLIYKSSPDEVKFLMIDPKVVELGVYNGIPHLLIPVVTDPRKAAGALNWAVQEMENRYKLFAEKSVKDIKGYNNILKKNQEEGALPQIVIIIDELADLMMVAPNDVEDAICRLAQMARAAGMHLVIATQRPSVDVITGVIKANIPSRISFAVSSQVDSRTILDMGGAEKLLGKGDMLFHPIGKPKPIRIQGAFVSEAEVEKTVEFLKEQGNTEYDNDIIEEINNENNSEEKISDDVDELLSEAIEMVINAGQASISLIQRKFRVGYARAARMIDQMEERGIVGGYEGSKPRQLLISKQQWHEMQMAQKE